MNKMLSDMKIAILMANGFCEQDVTAVQRALIDSNAVVHIVSSDSGLVNGWDGKGWGHHFMVDQPLSTALGADYDMLVLPGGQRSMDKLMMTAHTKRFVSSFMDSEKPIAVMGDALNLLVMTDNIKGRTVNGPLTMIDMIVQAGAGWSDEAPCMDGNLMSGAMEEGKRESFIPAMINFFTMAVEEDERAEKAA